MRGAGASPHGGLNEQPKIDCLDLGLVRRNVKAARMSLESRALMAIRAAPHFVAVWGRLYRIQHAHRLIDQGRLAEAARIIATLRREEGAADRWRAGFRA